MSCASKHCDPLVGLDIHIVQPPGPVPPLPLPHPHVGFIMDPFDYLPILGSTVKVGGLHRGLGGTIGMMMPPHIPIGGVFVKPPANDSEIFMGSSTVRANGEVLARLGLPALSCSDVGMPPIPRLKKKKPRLTLSLPTTFVLSIPSGVNVGGPPTISVMAIVMRAGIAALRKVVGKARKAWKARKARRQNGRCANGLDPVDLITGAVHEAFLDADDGRLRWERYYSTARAAERGFLGYGFRHGYQYELAVCPQASEIRLPSGAELRFPRLSQDGESFAGDGVRLRRLSERHYELDEGTRTIGLTEHDGAFRATSIRELDRHLALHYDMDRLHELRSDDGVRYFLIYDERRRLTSIERVDAKGPRQLAGYGYDADANLIESRDAENGRHRYRYDDAHRWVAKIDPLGYSYHWRYDSAGRCIAGTGEDGLWSGEIEYRPDTRETRLRQRGGEWILRYDESQTIREIVDPERGVRSRDVDERGLLVADVDSAGRKTRWFYRSDGAPAGTVDRFGAIRWGLDPGSDMSTSWVPRTAAEWRVGKDTRLPKAPAFSVRKDDCGRPVIAHDEDGGFERFAYNSAGNLIAYQDRDGRWYRHEVVSRGLIAAEIDSLGHRTRYGYSSSERVSNVIDPGGTHSVYRFDLKDRLRKVKRHGRVRDQYLYDAGDLLIEKWDGRGNLLIRLEYGDDQLVSARHLCTGGSYHYAYDEYGRVVRASSDQHEIDLKRDNRDRREHDLRDGLGIEHRYAEGRTQGMRALGRFVTKYIGTADDFRIIDPTGGTHRVCEQGSGLWVRHHATGTQAWSRFDHEGRCIEEGVEGTHQRSITHYRYSREGDLLEVNEPERGTTRYTWDAAHRLTSVCGPGGEAEYEHDAAGNLLRSPALDHVVLRSGNRLRFVNDESFEYDHRDHIAARFREDGSKICYQYDAADQLIGISDSRRDQFWTAAYDGLGRRVRAGFGDSQRQFYWDGDRLGAEIAPTGQVRVYIYPDPTALVPILFVDYDSIDADPRSGRVYTLFTDHLGMPCRVENASGQTVWEAQRADAYGRLEVSPTSEIELNLRWPGHYYDPETNLHYNRFRYYDPDLGRYLQSDPAGTKGGLNLYAYVSDPVSSIDLFGLSSCKDPVAPNANQAVVPTAEEIREAGARAAEAFERRFGKKPESIHVVGSHAEAMRPNPDPHMLPDSNSDIDLFIQTDIPGLDKGHGAGFEFFKEINPGRVPDHLTGLGPGPNQGMLGVEIPKSGTLDPFFGTADDLLPELPSARIW